MRWSDPAAWPGRKVPREGDAVTIARDMEVVLDVDPPALRSLTVDGKLTFSNDRDIELETEWIYLRGGELQIGSEASPHTRQAMITLTDKVPGEDVNTMGDRGIMLMRGALSLHGNREHTWSKLAKTAPAGSRQIEVLDARDWRAGDEIVLASTDFDPRQAERRTVAAIDGNAITLDRPLEYMHFGEITFGVDERGEVGLLTRNIRIQASDDAEKSYFGGHIMAMAGSKVQVSGVELNRMGQHLTLARYPMHWHLVGEGLGQYIRNSAIHDTYSRCVTVHGTNNVQVENNVTYNTVGHCFFLEDAVETGNRFVRNLGIQTKCHPTLPCVPTNLAPGGSPPGSGAAGQSSEHVLLPSDNTVSTFWITNPNNHFVDNVAAGSDQIGFWFAFPVNGIGQFIGTEVGLNTFPRRSPLGEFRGNVAHSNFDGLMFDRGPGPDNRFSVVGSNYHTARVNPADPDSERLESVFEDYTGYKNRHGAIWGRGKLHLFKNLKLADNAIGFTHAAGDLASPAFSSKVVDSLFVGETGNIGNPRTAQEIAYGRSLPQAQADYPIRGYEYYDFRQELENVTFLNFEDSATRKAGAISYLMYTSFGISTENSVEGMEFIDAKPVYFPPLERRWSSDFGSRAGWTGAVFHDKDGSVGGVPNSYIVIDNGIASDDEACETKPAWNAAVCQGDFGRVGVGPFGSGGPGTTGSPAGLAGLAGPGADGGPAGPAGTARPAGPGASAGPGAPGGPGGPAGRGGPGGGLGGPGGGAVAEPVILSRNGRQLEYAGETTIRSGAEVRVETARQAMSLSLREMDTGSWVIFELPGFTTAAAGAEQSSLAALRNASDTSYYKDGGTLWVKLVVPNIDRAGSTVGGPAGLGPRASLGVSR
jgi:cell migration-inducing and hyaluronan-binding protein